MNADDIVPLSSNRSTAAKLAALGIISGALSWVLINFSDELHLSFQFEGFGLLLLPIGIFPGLAFGLIFGALLHFRAKASWLRAIGYVLAAVLGYASAFHIAFYITTNWFSSHETALAYIVGGIPAGLAGSLLLGLLTKALFHLSDQWILRRPVATGTAAGALLGLASLDTHNGWGFLAFFILWQGTYGASLAPLLRGNGPSSA
jgi:hypothetical protein